MMVTPRDMEILRWIGRHGIVSMGQVTAHFFTGERAAYRRLHGLIGLGVVRRDPTHWRSPFVLRLTPAGARLADVGVGPAELVLAAVPHSLALVELTERLHAAHPSSTLITEREVRAARLRALREGQRRATGRIPDGVLVLPTGEHAAIELDLTPKRAYGVMRVIDAYSTVYSRTPDADRFNIVWWYVVPPATERVRAIVQEQRADDFIDVREWTDDLRCHP